MLLALLVLLVTLSGCESLSSLTIAFGGEGPAHRLPAPYVTVGNFQNNSSVHLDSGTFRGNFTIDANQVTITGRGTWQTVIEGDVRIEGNGCVIRQLRIRGNVYITGNNADLRGAVIEGEVFSSGHNNTWSRPPKR